MEYILEDWSFDRGVAWGYVYGHHSLEDGTYIHTSDIKKIELCDDSLLVRTCNSVYRLMFDSMDIHDKNKLETTSSILANSGVDADTIGRAKQLTRTKEKVEYQRIMRVTKTGDLYLFIAKNGAVRGYYRYKHRLFRMKPCTHSGIYCDSVIMKCYTRRKWLCNFCYFLHTDSMSSYSTEGIKRIIFNNVGHADVKFDSHIIHSREVLEADYDFSEEAWDKVIKQLESSMPQYKGKPIDFPMYDYDEKTGLIQLSNDSSSNE